MAKDKSKRRMARAAEGGYAALEKEIPAGEQTAAHEDDLIKRIEDLEEKTCEAFSRVALSLTDSRVALDKAQQVMKEWRAFEAKIGDFSAIMEGIKPFQEEIRGHIQTILEEKATIDQLRGPLGEFSSYREELESKREEDTARISRLMEKYDGLQEQIDSLSKNVGDIVARYGELTEKITEIVEKKILKRVEETGVESPSMKANITQIEAQLQEIRQKMGQIDQTAVDKMEDLSSKAGEITTSLNDLSREIGELAARTDGIEEMLSQMRSRLTDEAQSASAKTEEVAKSLELLTERIGTEEESVSFLDKKFVELETASRITGSRIEELKKDSASFLEQLGSLANKMKEIDTTASQASKRIEEEARRNEETWRHLRHTVETVDGAIDRLKESFEKIEDLREKVNQTENRLEGILAKTHEASLQSEINVERTGVAFQKLEQIEEKVKKITAPVTDLAMSLEEFEQIPENMDLGFEINDLFQVMVKHQASDLHLKAGAPPTVRLEGELIPVGNHILTENDCKQLVLPFMTGQQRRQLLKKKEIDFAYSIPGARFRVNTFFQKGSVSASFRMLRLEIPMIEELNLPPVLKKLASYNNGLILVTGPAGCGKSTTLAAMIDYINTHRKMHIITIEDPIEFVHQDKMSLVTQREIGSDTFSFAEALKRALRQDPNVILIGEMRDPETIMTAAIAAETGHLVLSTLHTPNSIQGINRIIDVFSGEQQKQFRLLLSNTLRGIISQRLLSRADEQGRIPAVEVLICTPTIAGLILEGKTNEIYPLMVQGATEGMQTFTASLTRLYEAGLISKEEALYHSDQPTEFRLAAEGHTTGTTAITEDSLMSWI